MVIEVYAACSHGSGAEEGEQGKKDTLRKSDGRMGGRRVRGVAEEEEESKGKREESRKLGMRGRHTVALAIHFCKVPTRIQSAPNSRPLRQRPVGED